ncbi:hypothetical protein GGF32_003787 [Allomyces javanicus]|nr:hypothetical protein GGF32_003787 [Allomyces javanicus]
MSYSRAHCPRSHRRYTMCGYHGVEDWCDKTTNWGECDGCRQNIYSSKKDWIPDALWRGLNGFNFYPLLEKDVPKHSLCETCAQCKKAFMSSMEANTISAGEITCLSCAGSPFAR